MKKLRTIKRGSISVYLILLLNIGLLAQDFDSHIVDSTFIGAAGIHTADIDNDGFCDIIAAGWEGNTITFYKSNGTFPLSWTKIIIDDDFNGASYVSIGDINGDGAIDVIASAFDDDELAWWSFENGIWLKYLIIDGFDEAHEVMAYDIDEDGDLDIIGVSAGLNEISWFENNGIYTEEWIKHLIVDDFSGARSVDVGDIDGDGDIDLAGAALLDNEVAWWRNDGGSPIQFTKVSINTSFTYSHKVQIVDVDQDGHLDILGTAYGNGIKWWKNGGEDPVQWTMKPVSGFGTAVVAAALDYDNDGDNDIVGTSQGSSRIAKWENEGDNELTWYYDWIENFGGVWPLHYGDLDNDGDLDLVAGGNSANQIRWYENDLIENEIVADFDGNQYQTVSIGNQVWFKQNLKAVHYSDGTEITEVWTYDDMEENADLYGRLYTWNAAMNYTTLQGAQGVCPDGWHVPTDSDWSELGSFLGGDQVAGGKLKETGTENWWSPNTGATNETGFSALPSGEYDNVEYRLKGETMVAWSSTETSSTKCLYRYISYDDAQLHTYNFYKNFRYSVRCIKDEIVGVNEKGEMERAGLIIHPNPAKDFVSIDFDLFAKSEQVEVSIYSGRGVLVDSFVSKSSENRMINISNLAKGAYVLQVLTEEHVYSKTFIKM